MSMISSPCRRCWRPTGSAPEGGLASDSPVGDGALPVVEGITTKGGDITPPQHAIPSTTRHPLHLGRVGRSGPPPFKRASTLRHPLQARKHAQASIRGMQARSRPPFRARKPAHAHVLPREAAQVKPLILEVSDNTAGKCLRNQALKTLVHLGQGIGA